MLTGASLAQDRGRMEARIEALTAEVSGLKKECQVNSLTAYVIGHFGVRKFLAFRTRLSAKHFLWQRVFLHANKNSSMYISMTSHWVSLRNSGLGQLENGLSNDVFQRCTSTGSGLFFFIFGRWFCPVFQSNRLCKSKEAKQYKFYIVKACEQGKGLTSGWRPSLKKAFVKLTVRELKLRLGL